MDFIVTRQKKNDDELFHSDTFLGIESQTNYIIGSI